MDARQEKIFDKIARDVVDSALDGYNGTIFAYGQTGSGKTFTMTGGTESYDDRGIIPRTLSYIFNQKEQRNQNINVYLRYLQIYNGTGYDLLNTEYDADKVKSKISDLKAVKPMEKEDGSLQLAELSIH
jgi:kinesin family protein 6/9